MGGERELPSHNCEIRVTCEVVVAEDAPPINLRYTFLDERVLTTKEDWVDRSSVEEQGEGLPALEAPDFVKGEHLRVERTHAVKVDAATIERLNASPITCFFLCREGVSYVETVHCDLSSLLVNAGCKATLDGRSKQPGSRDIEEEEEVDGFVVPADCVSAAPLDVKWLRISVSMEGDFMSEEALKRYNPLRVEFGKARRLPGVRSEAANVQALVGDPEGIMRKFCRPTYAVLRPPLLAESSSSNKTVLAGLRRASATNGYVPRNGVDFERHTVAYLTGGVERHCLEEMFASQPLAIELHDRDLLLLTAPVDVADPESVAEAMRNLTVAPASNLTLWNAVESNPEIAADAIRTLGSTYGNGGWAREQVKIEEVKTVFDVDALFCSALKASWHRAGEDNAHGMAAMMIDPLLKEAGHKASAFLTARKRRFTPKGGVDDWRLSDAQRLAGFPGSYSDAESAFGLTISLQRPLRPVDEGVYHETRFWEETLGDQPGSTKKHDFSESGLASAIAPREALFGRAILIIPYEDSALLRDLLSAIEAVNEQWMAQKEVACSLRSYQLTSEELAGTENGQVDVLCGFQIIDAHSRTLCLEGKVKSLMTTVMEAAPRRDVNDGSYCFLFDPSVRFSTRLYSKFNLDLKKIRLRDPLPVLASSPEIYNRTKVSALCFEALHRLMDFRRAPAMKQLATAPLSDGLCGMPTVDMLLEVESKFGEPISMADIMGVGYEPKKKKVMIQEEVAEEEAAAVVAAVVERRMAATDDKNPAFDLALRSRTTRDILAERAIETDHAREAGKRRIALRQAQWDADPLTKSFVYSSQKLQYTELKKAEERERLSKLRDVTFVRSSSSNTNYLSQTVPLVDDQRFRQDEAIASKQQWMTQRGFIYPAPRQPKEYSLHPNAPSQSRVDELKEPWDDSKPPVAASTDDFDCIPSNGAMYFGGQNVPEFQREYDGAKLGHFSQLPRGRDLAKKKQADRDYNRSVHLSGDGLAKEAAEDKRREEELWQSKVVVDSTDFLVDGFCQREKPSQLDRRSDILHGPVKSVAMKIIRNARLPSGKVVKLRPAPYSMFARDKFAQAQDYTTTLREYDYDQGDSLDFMTHIHKDMLKHNSEKLLCRKAITEVTPPEKAGDARWLVADTNKQQQQPG